MPWYLLLLIFLGTLLLFFSIHYLANYFFHFQFSSKYESLSSEEKRSCQHEFTSTVAVTSIFIAFAIGTIRLYTSIERRWFEDDYSSYLGILLTLGYTTYEELLYLKYGKELIYHIHHLLASIITIYACVYPRLHFFICWGGTIEITGIFVNAFLISKRLNLSSSIVNLFGGLMWLSFVIFRFVSLILMFATIFTDSYYHPHISISKINLPYLLICGFSAVVLFMLSLYWLGKMSYRLFYILYELYQSSRLVHPESSTLPVGLQNVDNQPALSSPIEDEQNFPVAEDHTNLEIVTTI